jgi:hypothetical protein
MTYFAMVHGRIDALYNWLDKTGGKKKRLQPHFSGGLRAVDLKTSKKTKIGDSSQSFGYTVPSLKSDMRGLSGLFGAAHLLFDEFKPFPRLQSRCEERIGKDSIHGGWAGVAPDSPFSRLSTPDEVLDDDILAAVLHLLRFLNELCLPRSMAHNCGLAHGLSGCDAEDYLADTGVGDFGNCSRAVGEDADSSEQGVGSAEPAVAGPGDLLIRRAALDLVDELGGETITA